jgi:hypothetical protein
MKLRDVAMTLVGGTILYVSMAACAERSTGTIGSGSHGTTASGGTSTGHPGGSGGAAPGTGGAGGAVHDGGLADVLGNPVPPANADPTAGSRLKPKYRQGDDGAKEYLAGQWFDSMRGEDCTFQLAADGKTRCLPDGTTFRYYADAACATPMVLMQNTCAPPKYGTAAVDPTCGLDPSANRVFAIGQATTPMTIYGKSGASCFAIGPTTTDYQYYAVGAEVTADNFVAATVGHD